MRVSLEWLKEYFSGKMGEISAEEISYTLTKQGIGVDQIIRMNAGFEHTVVGRLIEVKQHPNADRLTVCKVEIGDGQIRSIVCGAKNHKANDYVIVALPGAQLPNGVYIKETSLRGVPSQGMLCSKEELGLLQRGEKEEGILILNETKAPIGTPGAQALNLSDIIFELDITPNRADCLSMIGVARELAAGLKKQLQIPTPQFTTDEQHRAEQEIAVRVMADKECPYFTLQVIEGVKVGSSPAWMVARLEKAGIRSVNNIVDITNYVMLETGQPLHAYDLSKIHHGVLLVRRAKAGQPFKALDESTHELTNQDLVICDEDQVLGLAGVMGGESSGITEKTVDIALEAAWFDPEVVRKTARRFGFHTESSHRFERGVDRLGVDFASQRAVQLIQKHAGGTVLGGMIRVGSPAFKSKTINVDLRRFQKLIGLEISIESAAEWLKKLDLQVETKTANVLKVTPPSFRHDLTREVDILEELARMVGYDQIPSTLPGSETRVTAERNALWHWILEMKKECVAAGFSETIQYAFVPEKHGRMFSNPLLKQSALVTLKNPLSADHAVLRTSGVIGLLSALQRNERFGIQSVALFEQSSIFGVSSSDAYPQIFRKGVAPRKDIRGVRELNSLAFLVAGPQRLDTSAEAWDGKTPRSSDFYDLKGRLEQVFRSEKLEWVRPAAPVGFLHPTQQAEITLYRQTLGWAGRLHPDLMEQFDLKSSSVWVAEILLDPIAQQIVKGRYRFEMPSTYQKVERDAAFIVDRSLQAAALFEAVRKLKLPILRDTVIFDVYEGSGVESGKKSVALRFTFQSFEQTLTDEQISTAFQQCIDAIRQSCQAQLRGNL